MSDPVRIFVCYKKRGHDGRENNSAYQLYSFLSEIPQYEVWMDEGLDAGLLWEKTIYERLLSSDVLVLAIGEGTSQSEWVRRELSMAMAFGIQIIPVGLSISESQLHNELLQLGLTGIHYKRPFNIASQTARAITSELAPAIARARENTRLSGHALLKSIHDRLQRVAKPAKPNISISSRAFDVSGKKINIHVTSGDIFRLNNFDILVNSENDYMQMARIFDMASLSSKIRHYGSATDKGFLEDTIQLEIERIVSGRPRPVPPGTAVVTSSGGPTSSLYRNNGVSHIVHVAAVQAVLAENRIVPLQSDDKIRECVANAFVAVQQLTAARGIISPQETAQRTLQEAKAYTFSPRNIVLPLFGSGRGGRAPADIAPIVFDGILDFFRGPSFERDLMPIVDCHVSVYSEDDVSLLVNALSKLDG